MPCVHTYDPKLSLQMTQHPYWQRFIRPQVARHANIKRRVGRIPLVHDLAMIGWVVYEFVVRFCVFPRLGDRFIHNYHSVPFDDLCALTHCKCWREGEEQGLLLGT